MVALFPRLQGRTISQDSLCKMFFDSLDIPRSTHPRERQVFSRVFPRHVFWPAHNIIYRRSGPGFNGPMELVFPRKRGRPAVNSVTEIIESPPKRVALDPNIEEAAMALCELVVR
jgi:hypothetical protein